MTLLRNAPNASPHPLSELGSQPAISAYHEMHCEREGSPGVDADVENAGTVRDERQELGGLTAKVYGVRRLERSESG